MASNFAGYLVAVSKDNDFTTLSTDLSDETATGYIIPDKYIRYDTFDATYQPIDINSGESLTSGRLYRKVLKRRKLKVTWNVPGCDDNALQDFLDYLRLNWKNEKYCQTYVRAWIPSLNAYKTDMCYLTSDLNFHIVNKTPYTDAVGAVHKIMYGETRISLIGQTTASATYRAT